jgi:diacylglycerol O-acyltransferase-1
MIVDNLANYGILAHLPWNILSDPASAATWAAPQPILAASSWLLSILISFIVESLAARRTLPEAVITGINVIVVGVLNCLLPCLWVLTSRSDPMASMLYLSQAVVLWMKLISYAHVNSDLRKLSRIQRQDSALFPTSPKGSSNDLSRNGKKSSDGNDTNGKPNLNLFSEVKDLQPPFLQYPQNISFVNLLYFCVAPTLCYQLNYPRSPSIRWRYVATILLRMLVVASLIIFAVEQYIMPTLENSVKAMHDMDMLQIVERLLKLSIPNTYVWLLGFYFYFHLWLNLLAELTRFGDRLFYRDWLVFIV